MPMAPAARPFPMQATLAPCNKEPSTHAYAARLLTLRARHFRDHALHARVYGQLA